MTQFTKRADLPEMKANKAALTAIIKSTLKVDAGPRSVLDIQAVAEGFTDYNTAKGLVDKDYYSVKSNLGTKDKPFFVERELGYLPHDCEAQRAAHVAINDCNSFMTWYVYKNDVRTGMKIETPPTPEKGLEVQITITGDTFDDLDIAWEQVQGKLDTVDGNKGETFSYWINSAGDEYDPADDIKIELSHDYVILDSQGIIEHSDDLCGFSDFWDNRENNIDSYEGFLVYAEEVNLAQAKESINNIFHCIATTSSGGVMSGDYNDMIEAMKDDNRSFVLFREIERD